MDFAYDSTLASNELRLLQPVAVYDDFLRFKTRRVKRESRTPYTAVSYTWGNEDASEVIYLDNRPFYVRPNLWSCLFYMARAARNAAWDYLWVDAICIDQTNNAERNSQVRLMDQTYKDAVCVSVWLGLATLPEDIMQHISTQMPIKRVESDGFDWFDSIVDLSNRPYWSRVWVIQEFLLGRDVNLYCSDSQMNWVDFQEIICQEAGIRQFYDALHDSPLGDRRSTLTALPLVMGRHMDKHPEFLQPLCDLLIDHHKSECKDPRDRVFALLGLITTDEREFLNSYFPDYTLTEDHVRIITLAHLTQFPEVSRMGRNGKNITADSEELFLGLGVGPKSERKRLLRRARKIDYLARYSPSQILDILASDDQMEEYESEDLEEQEEVCGTEPRRSRRSSTKIWLMMFVVVITALAVGWWIAKSTKI